MADVRWELATDVDEVAELLSASDRHAATAAAPAPDRSREITERRVGRREVHALRRDGRLVAMFTLSPEPPSDTAVDVFPPAARPVFVSRLALRPDDDRDPLVGARCLRRAIGIARNTGCDALRAQTNPDLERVHSMLLTLGFRQHGPTVTTENRRHAHLELRLVPEPPPGAPSSATSPR